MPSTCMQAPELKQWLMDHGEKYGVRYPVIMAEMALLLQSVEKARETKAPVHKVRALLDRVSDLFGEQGALPPNPIITLKLIQPLR